MTISYRVGNGLYINMTNRCSNDCKFCIRRITDSYGSADSLWLSDEPSREDVLEDVLKQDFSDYEEIVFCGYGEPTYRLDDLLWLCKQIKKSCSLPIRVNTNGHASLIAGYETPPLFSEAVDRLSISLNAPDADEYNSLCKPIFGVDAYQGVLDFAKNSKDYVPEVILSVVEGTTDIERCRSIAESIGLPLRIR
ncbi:MAG: TatD family nuclease-associated radical SAM protein [Oscillospiraceae bacterium]|nr:TatD family nuclease-associated radical SAM protein [Oscillospiraceae bacterium]